MPTAPELLVVNTGPLIALGHVDAFEIVGELPIKFVAPSQVAGEIEAGSRLGHPVTMPGWVNVQPLAGPLGRVAVATLDEGEAAVIQLAVERAIGTVCIDEWRRSSRGDRDRSSRHRVARSSRPRKAGRLD